MKPEVDLLMWWWHQLLSVERGLTSKNKELESSEWRELHYLRHIISSYNKKTASQSDFRGKLRSEEQQVFYVLSLEGFVALLQESTPCASWAGFSTDSYLQPPSGTLKLHVLVSHVDRIGTFFESPWCEARYNIPVRKKKAKHKHKCGQTWNDSGAIFSPWMAAKRKWGVVTGMWLVSLATRSGVAGWNMFCWQIIIAIYYKYSILGLLAGCKGNKPLRTTASADLSYMGLESVCFNMFLKRKSQPRTFAFTSIFVLMGELKMFLVNRNNFLTLLHQKASNGNSAATRKSSFLSCVFLSRERFLVLCVKDISCLFKVCDLKVPT